MLVGDLGEAGLLERIGAIFAETASDITVPMGDDAAVFLPPSGRMQVWTADLMLEDIHFERSWMSAHDLGRKSLAVNLSDLAAMGARPACALLSLGLPADTGVDYATDICRGFAQLARETGTAVIGGDTCRSSSGISISVAAGGTVETARAILRSGARVGDSIFVSGYPGSAAAGMRLTKAGQAPDYPLLRDAFIAPSPRLALGEALSDMETSALIDLSDGIAADLGHVCDQSGVGAEIILADLPVSGELEAACARHGWSPAELALRGGEDYELLFTLPQESSLAVSGLRDKAGVPVTPIGTVTDDAGRVFLVKASGERETLPPRGFDHFREND